jgi:RNA polymerase sigma factor (TIGR02999 family)
VKPPEDARHPSGAADTVEPDGAVTLLLAAARRGEVDALDRLFDLVYRELRGLAHRHLYGQSPSTLSTTVLVHEAYLRLARAAAQSLQDRQHFFAVASRAMRQIVIDHARRRTAEKRGGGLKPIDVDDVQIAVEGRAEELVALDAALHKLEAADPRLGTLVEMRFFGGRTLEEIAELTGRSERTLKRDWRRARAFLYRELGEAGIGGYG